MLTSFQCDVVAYTVDGEILCPSCAEADAVGNGLVDEDGEVQRVNADGLFIHYYGILDPEHGYGPVIRYALDEEPCGYDCDRCGATISEPDQDFCIVHESWHSGETDSGIRYCDQAMLAPEATEADDPCSFLDEEVDPNPPLPRWGPCSGCGARDGERHREDCSYLS